MYRIVFNPISAAWLIELRQGFFSAWIAILEKDKVRHFVDYDKAVEYVDQVGLDYVYKNYHSVPAVQLMQGAEQRPQNLPQYMAPAVLHTRRAA